MTDALCRQLSSERKGLLEDVQGFARNQMRLVRVNKGHKPRSCRDCSSACAPPAACDACAPRRFHAFSLSLCSAACVGDHRQRQKGSFAVKHSLRPLAASVATPCRLQPVAGTHWKRLSARMSSCTVADFVS